MSSWGQDFLKGFTEVNSLRDYTHASKTFRTNYYELKPRFKFLFHVKFNINNDIIGKLQAAKIFLPENIDNLSLAVKTVDLPKYKIDTHTLNQYNRKRVVQTKLNYEPVNVTFQDDGGDNIRNLWYQYYSYYYRDPSQQYVPNIPTTNGSIGQIQQKQNGFSYPTRDIYSAERVGNVNDWGFIGESYLDLANSPSGKPPFFQDIEIYGFDQHKYARYILVNPIITNWNHDQYDYAQGGGVMQNSMTIAYETVKYYSGALGKPDANVNWPIVPHYDTTPSAISRPGSTATIGGQGGLLSTGEGILADLESGSVAGLIGAAQKAGTTYNTFKGKNLRSIVQAEAVALGRNIVNQQVTPSSVRSVINKADGWVFPTATQNRALQSQANTDTPPI
jgi:hypothetical protein